MKKFILFILCLPVLVYGQKLKTNPQGIKFETNLSWDQVKEKAEKEKKYIFVDSYTTWCAPCRWMSDHIFPQKKVGDYMNAHFISVKVQMDKTAKDAEYIKSWYPIAEWFTQKYKIDAYPTSLFFTPEGEIVHRIEGSGTGPDAAEKFIYKASAAFDTKRAYYANLAEYMEKRDLWKNHLTDSSYLYKALDSALKYKDGNNIIAIRQTYVDLIKDPFVPQNLKTIYGAVNSIHDKYFDLLVGNTDKVALAMKISPNALNNKLKDIVYNDGLKTVVYDDKQNPVKVDWDKLQQQMVSKYPAFGDRLIVEEKIAYYKRAKDSTNWAIAIETFMDRYGKLEISHSNLAVNNKAWDVFSLSNDKILLKKAIAWMKPVIAQYKPKDCDLDWENLDTYANLLYKTGDKDNAILWEKRAIELVGSKADGQKSEFEITLAKMQKGEKTWRD